MRSLTAEVIAVLEAGGLTVGDAMGGTMVQGTFVPFDPPFVTLYPLVQTRDGSPSHPWSDVDKWFEAITEAKTRDQAELWADRLEARLTASDLVIVSLELARVGRDDATAAPSRFKAWTRFEVLAHTPTGA